MQPPAAQDLAHTRTRPVHWLATAAAMAAVIALAGLLQPGAATASQSGSPAGRPAPQPSAAAAPDPAGVDLPMDCGDLPIAVVKKATGDLDGDGAPETVVVARCDAGSGTPPSGLYVIARDKEGVPRAVASLLAPQQRQSVTRLIVRNGAVGATLLGYSSTEVPSCCPDEREQVEWRWEDGKFLRIPQDATRAL